MIFEQVEKNKEIFTTRDATSELYKEYLEQDFRFAIEYESGKFLFIPPSLKVQRMVIYDQNDVNLSSFGNPDV